MGCRSAQRVHDLTRFHDKWYCTFRESEGHVGGDGKLRVLESIDGDRWSSAALLTEEGVDLRDPKLSITADGRLMIVAGGSIYRGKELVGRRPRVAFSKDGRQWSAPQPVLSEGDWLWRVTWHDGRAYGVSYGGAPKGKDSDWALTLWSSKDGVQYERITSLQVTGSPNETTLGFMPDGEMIALVRRESGNARGGSDEAASPTPSGRGTRPVIASADRLSSVCRRPDVGRLPQLRSRGQNSVGRVRPDDL